MAKITSEQAEKELKKYAGRVTLQDLAALLKKQEELWRRVYGPLGRYMDDVKLLFSLVRDYYRGEYREVPWRVVAAAAGTLLYIMNPLDLIPDFLPGVGKMDDLMVLLACLSLIRSDLERYKGWRDGRGNLPD